MNFDDLIFSKYNFSEVRKDVFIPLIEELIRYADKARREGLLSLEEELGNIKDPFLKMGIQLIVDGNDPDLVEEILERVILFSKPTQDRVLEYCIIRTAILAIQSANSPYILHHQLYAYIGMEYIEEYMNLTNSLPNVKEVSNQIDFIPLDISLEFNELFIQLDDISTQRLLREIDIVVLAFALHNSSFECQEKIMKNLSSRTAYMLAEDRQIISVNLDDCIENQKMILELYERLVEMGEIIGSEES